MGLNTSISSDEEFTDDKIASGRFNNVSEEIRPDIRLPEDEKIKIQQLKSAITHGIESGVASNFDPKKHLEKIKAAKRKNGL
ncbi:MAG: type II toxin-antitoxin system ParD family antitoxin [Chitinophagales bacterium]|nr:type II toxin-antitoxin system ParD family antitoxin [Chitinophagales bacterium]